MHKFWSWIRDDGGGRVLRLEGPIDEESFWSDGVTPKQFREELYAEDGDVTIWINSPGGNVFAAAEIYTMIRDYPGTVTVKIDAIAASAASVVAMAGDRVLVSPVGMIMIHDPMTIAMGNSRAMEKAITTLNEVKESILNAYVAKTGLSRNKVAKLMTDETWLNAKKAVELGFADEIMFADKKTETEPDPVEEESGDSDGDDDTPKEERDGEIHLKTRAMAEALEGVLYSTRIMGQTILNQIGAFAEDENEASPSEGQATPAEDESEGEAAPVAENSLEEEAPVRDADDKPGRVKADPDKEKADGERADPDEDKPGDDEDKPDQDDDKPDQDDDKPDADEADEPDEGGANPEDDPDKDKPKDNHVPSNILPEGFIAIDQNGRTQDGSVPYIILKNQLDRMR